MSDSKQRPIYVVTHKPSKTSRLVRAGNLYGAMSFVAKDTLEVRRPTQDELIGLAAVGTKVEEAPTS